jgi:hypothetical protein
VQRSALLWVLLWALLWVRQLAPRWAMRSVQLSGLQ